ncbi:MAG TPA: glycosyl hydrolase 115 family protein [Kiritimatiellia bacterium]|nr:glycosyl hydrolase 115 family protein [Kiritimatiellia bacterium]HPS08435.1 glycosyl hydrolase 115 family protein [Kiritimatiellia bacterium]
MDVRKLISGLAVLACACEACAAGFEWVTAERVAPIIVAAGEPEFVRLAAEDLASDVQKITGRKPEVRAGGAIPPGPCVTIATRAGGPWESYRADTAGERLVIEGGDARGTMFGVYAFCERYLKVDPLYFWSGREPAKRAELRWDAVSLASGAPSFKYRGWFINDEDLLTEWKESAGERHIDYQFYNQVVNPGVMRAVVEALVRSGYNLIIPASFIDILNPAESAIVEECARRGVFVSQHHVEPMGVSAFSYFNYWKARGRDLKYSYFSHPAEVREVWRTYAQKWAACPNVIWQLGLRGAADRPMWLSDASVPQSDEERGRIISEAMAEQVRILDEVCPGKPRRMSTTLWAEGSVLNQKGLLKIPEGTIIVFADNSPGWKWQRDFYETPRNPKNAYGVYYHHALIGCGPHLAQAVPPHKTCELLRAARERGAGEYAIFNVSNIREFVLGIGATAEMTWRMDGYDPDAWLDRWVGDRFSKRQAEIANAYRIYFNAYQLHDLQQVPFLLDGHMFSAGNKALSEMAKKIKEKRIGTGASAETMRPSGGGEAKAAAGDAFWDGLSDAMPKPLPRRETLKRVVAEKAGFELALLHARTAAGALPEGEAAFLSDNLIYPCGIMRQTSAWLERLLAAHEALDLGDRPACARALREAGTAFEEVPRLAEEYCSGKWKEWYRGCKKLNVSATMKKTREVAELAEKAAGQK